MNEALILSHEEVSKRYEELGDEFEHPYVFKILKGNQTLYYVGTAHTFDSHDSVLERNKQFWDEFVEETRGKQRTVLIEGGTTRPYEDFELAVAENGERGAMSYWANQANIDIESPEPALVDEMHYLEDKFPRDAIAYYYFARVARQWYRTDKSVDFKDYVQGFIANMGQTGIWPDYDFSYEHMIVIHDERNGHAISDIDKHMVCFRHSSSPSTSRISNESGTYRDKHIYSEIVRHWGLGKSIFVLFGSAHALAQEAALKVALK